MGDPVIWGISIPKDYVSLVAPIAAAILAPVVTTAVGLIARFGLQGKIAEAEYRLKRLDILKRALEVETAFGDQLPPSGTTETLRSEYLEIMFTIATLRAAEHAKDFVAVPARKKGLRALILPKPWSAVGWIPTILYYLYGPFAVVYVLVILGMSLSGDWEEAKIGIYGLVGSVAISLPARFWALHNWEKHFAARQMP